ncbi:carboxypeptidase-like regulatory domain-containing protein [uncultured Winogradskyella sp.]|uniref:TonB-dependent receptor n=1 Tax=uncultured Winogradskyella sp. TaxID=395353 RepID=UPI003513495F
MRNILAWVLVITALYGGAQNTGSIAGKLTDKDFNNEPLPFANIVIKGTSKGTTSNEEGLYLIDNVEPGTYTVVFSFVGYETQEIEATVEAGKVTTINVPMGASAAALDEIVITTELRKESEVALLLAQKNAVEIKESIGAEQLTRLGVSDASAATTKISGVSKSDGAGQIYVRGLGDRYLTTTLNGLPIPSDNIDKKNIDLELFPTRFIQNVSISKTFSPKNSADQASGNIDISSKQITSRKDFGIGMSGGLNTNANDVYDDFKVTAVNDNLNLGIFSRPYQNDNLRDALLGQTWNTGTESMPLDYSFGFNAGGFIDEDGKLRMFVAGGQSVSHEYREGLFREYDVGQRNDSIPDGDNRFWRREVNTSGMFGAEYRINSKNKLSLNTFAINKVFEETYEAGREGGAIIFEELTPEEAGNQFVRDQNLRNTFLLVSQLLGTHDISDNNTLEWGVSYNRLAADEPNRIRNEINIMNENTNLGIPDGQLQLGNTGGFQQRKQSQEILDNEFNGRIMDAISLKRNEDGDDIYKVSFGGDARNKERDFRSDFIGFDENSGGTLNPASIDNLTEVFTQQNIDNGNIVLLQQPSDFYTGTLLSYGGFVDFVGVFGNLTAEVGLRYQNDNIDVEYDVNNAPGGRVGDISKAYERFYPMVNFKYAFDDRMALRLSSSLSQTLPEFKEIAPFEYVDPLGQITSGNRFIEASRNFNIDLKFEFFPSGDELLSLTTYYKNIQDPINQSLRLGGEGIFSYFNTSNNAEVFGIELEGRMYLIPKVENRVNLRLSGNVSYIDHKQDLRSDGLGVNGQERSFQYRGIDEIGLEGASDWTTNVALTLNSGQKNPLEFTVAANYASDRIFAIGAPRSQRILPDGSFEGDVFFNGEIIEQGVVVLDFIFRKDISENLSIGVTAKNILNPVIERYQLVSDDPGGSTATRRENVLTYNRGIDGQLSLNYKF